MRDPQEELKKGLSHLPTTTRRVLEMMAMDGKGAEFVAKELGIGVDEVSENYRAGLRKLRGRGGQ
ncbi:hypothetical protein [Vogesella sp. XCS3]|uniref:hypothetical protein n=1 Tax=Vogesella sp. XCS3 TaxID=2877939 RepID=UPI001D0B1449|nr:hypothetical protein [Vogesella sp. XCS3]UDM18919.1 hypothetical protein LCH97_17905 [Vogesella sp. XCS3]